MMLNVYGFVALLMRTHAHTHTHNYRVGLQLPAVLFPVPTNLFTNFNSVIPVIVFNSFVFVTLFSISLRLSMTSTCACTVMAPLTVEVAVHVSEGYVI